MENEQKKLFGLPIITQQASSPEMEKLAGLKLESWEERKWEMRLEIEGIKPPPFVKFVVLSDK